MSRWFDVDEAAHRSHAKAYSLNPPVAHPAGTLVEVGLLDDALVDKLRAGAATGAVIRFGGQVGALVTGARQVAGLCAVWRANAPAGLPELVLPLPGVGGPGIGGPGSGRTGTRCG
ncbi:MULTISPECIES: hypothetical protein [unclassified Micromonospora]|uniref:hypothetical protein n=1 Tax=unclassified Micromonospora TaxID=2617518 RepID=UPI003A88685C